MLSIAEEGRDGEDGGHAPRLADEWKVGCAKSPMWWSEDESVSSSCSREGNVGNDALHVIGLYGLGGKIFLLLQDWEPVKGALHCRMALETCCARKCVKPGMLSRGLLSRHMSTFFSPWTDYDSKGEVCGERKPQVRRKRGRSSCTERAWWYSSSQFCHIEPVWE